MLTEKEFWAYKAQGFNLVPIWKKIHLPDLPASIDLYKAFSETKQDFIFEIGRKESVGKYSIIGLKSDHWFVVKNEKIEEYEQNKLVNTIYTQDPLNEFLQQTKRWNVPKICSLPTFMGGFFGFFNTDCTKLHEPIFDRKKPSKQYESLSCAVQWLTKNLIVLDHAEQSIYCITHLKTDTIQNYIDGYQYLAYLTQKLDLFLSLSTQKPFVTSTLENKINLSAQPSVPFTTEKKYQIQMNVDRKVQVFLANYVHIAIKKNAIDLYGYIAHQIKKKYQYFINFNDVQMLGVASKALVYEQSITTELRNFFKDKKLFTFLEKGILHKVPVPLTSSLELCGGLVGYIDFHQASKHIPMFHTGICQHNTFIFKSVIAINDHTNINLAWNRLIFRKNKFQALLRKAEEE